MENLATFIKSRIKISDEDLQVITSCFKQRLVRKNQFILKKGQVAREYYFIQSGGLRVFTEQGEVQITGWLAFENEFFGELLSMKSETPTRFFIQAIEDTILLTIKWDDMEGLYKQYPDWQQFGRNIWEDAFRNVVEAILSYQTMTAEERYLAMMEKTDLLQRVPLKDLSSYLGITQTSLSRLRKKIR